MAKNKLLSVRKILIIKNRGFSIVEIVVASSVLAFLIVGLASAYLNFNNYSLASGLRMRAFFLAEEGLEATRNIRDNNFANLIAGNYGLSKSGGQWNFSSNSEIIDEFSRQITISEIDARTKKIESKISWLKGLAPSSIILTTYLTNWQRMGLGNWTNMFLEAGLNFNGNQAGFDVFLLDNYAYVVRAGGTPTFVIIDLSTPANPQVVGSLDLSGNANALYVVENYAYVASTNNNTELQIIDVANKNSPQLIGSYNAPGNNDATDIFAVGSVVYFSRLFSNTSNQNEFYIINVANPSTPTILGSLNLENSVNKLYVKDNYAYLGSADDIREFQVIDISNKTTPSRVSILNLTGTSDGSAIEFANDTIYLGLSNGNIYPINIANPLAPTLILSNGFSVGGGNPLSLTWVSDYLAVGTSDNSNEIKLFDLSNQTNPTLFSSFNVPGTAAFNCNGLAYSGGLDRLLAVGPLVAGNNNYQFIIIKPQ